MSVIKYLESIRTPFFDVFFAFFTNLGSEVVFMAIGFFIFWCISKKRGYYILSISFFGLLINQFLKITFRIPRPWVRDKSFTIVEAAREEAIGYSFPSGHTQISVGAYGSMAKVFANKIIRAICIILCVLIPFSRMYLGVHTPLDVLVSVGIALALIFVLYPIIEKAYDSKGGLRILFGIMLLSVIAYVLYVFLYPFPKDIEITNLLSAREYAFKILGLVMGLWAGYEIDTKYIKFDTKAVWWAQIIKLVAGLLLVVAIKEGTKALFVAISCNIYLADCIRYMLISLFAIGVWPITFKYFKK